ncbi:HAD hydrolase-like protein [Bacillus sp. B1-b2]|uniref:HAD hydrolase-like protein n=1 Tax=Bacillus sp. B1-b2 TaxID=2653201 RepID=UPI001261888B|nr:HAD hydrolase-like protein [Bacillus sp. B1-b2]KAB7663585.1 HAD hydrolase-like protein [Bacillus sp. B1-b2]
MTKAIIFDMDGTLFQTDKILEMSLEDTFQYLRSINKWEAETPLNKYREIMGVPLPKVWEALMPHHSIHDRKLTDQYFLKRLIENISNGRGALYPHVKETLQYLVEQKYTIFIASNGLIEYLKAIVDYYQLNQWITETFSIEQIDSLNKSDLVKLIVDTYHITNGMVIGDRLSDIKAAKDNGLVSVGCYFDFAKEEELAFADMVIHNLNELTQIELINK